MAAAGGQGALTRSLKATRIAAFNGPPGLPGRSFKNKAGWGVTERMYAVIETGGKQYRVAVGETVRVETLPVEVGQDVTLGKVLLIADGADVRVGAPALSETVTARVESHGRGEKIRIFKTRRRKHYRKHAGHRQNYTELKILAIAGKSEQSAQA